MKLQQYIIESERTLIDKGDKFNIIHAEWGIITEFGELVDHFKRHEYYGKPFDAVNVKEELGDIMWYIAIYLRLHPSHVVILDDAIFLDFGINQFSKIDRYSIMTNNLRKCLNNVIDDIAFLNSSISLIASFGKVFNIEFEDILQTNINKLKARFPHKFTSEKALNRDLEKERQILEGVN